MPTSPFASPSDTTPLVNGKVPGLDEVSASGRPVRLLHVEDDRAYAVLIDQVLKTQLPAGSKVEHAESLTAALHRLDEKTYDAVLLDLSLPDSDGMETLSLLSAEHPALPIIVMSGHDDSATFLQAQQRGARDVVFKSRLDGQFLGEALKQAIGDGQAAKTSDAAKRKPGGHHERRRHPRYLAEGAAVIIPIESGFRPGAVIAATVVNLSLGGVALLAERGCGAEGERCLVGIEQPDGSFHYTTVQVRHRQSLPEGVRIGAEFVAPADDPFDERNLVPRLDTKTLQLVPPIAEEILHHWTLQGVMRAYLIDRVKTCPKCQSLPTFRDGCSQCGSARIASSPLIHHFACAFVAPAGDFDRGGVMVCPKCRARDLVIGADFEQLAGPFRCLDCDWSDTQAASIGECLKCGLRFPGEKSFDKEVVQFHIERIDPLKLLGGR